MKGLTCKDVLFTFSVLLRSPSPPESWDLTRPTGLSGQVKSPTVPTLGVRTVVRRRTGVGTGPCPRVVSEERLTWDDESLRLVPSAVWVSIRVGDGTRGPLTRPTSSLNRSFFFLGLHSRNVVVLYFITIKPVFRKISSQICLYT